MMEMPEGSRFIGITSDVAKVVDLATSAPPGLALAVDVPLMRKQAMAIAGEDRALANVIVQAMLKSLALNSGLVFDDNGMCIGPRDQHAIAEFDGDERFVHGAATGACGALLQIIKTWPDDPLHCADMPLHAIEERVIVMMGDVARRMMGLEETL